METACETAISIVNGERQDSYGNPLVNLTRIAAYWSLALDMQVTPEKAAELMILLKLARLDSTPDHRDSIIDIAGYAECYDYVLRHKETVGDRDPATQ